ncbi:hypothetical protein [Candidatus Erwinia haradaeae]|uniref:hypothetical protein n=1 Tax=Candidatus Erwinia haradaeae TaxID=1922217 RepID=UPI001E576D9B|nr:hypothetical protein [Candidatus Erwinia haradaeae]
MKKILSIQSHAVFDHGGKVAAKFLMRQCGANVWPLNTVQYSNHIQYGYWPESVMSKDYLIDIVFGIGDIKWLETSDEVLSGYLGSIEQ